MNSDIIYVPFGEDDSKRDIIKWECRILKVQFINHHTKFGQYKVFYNDPSDGYFFIGCKGTGLKIDNVKYMADDNGVIDIKTINTYLHNREITEALEKI